MFRRAAALACVATAVTSAEPALRELADSLKSLSCMTLGYTAAELCPKESLCFVRVDGPVWENDTKCRDGADIVTNNTDETPSDSGSCLMKAAAALNCLPDKDGNYPEQCQTLAKYFNCVADGVVNERQLAAAAEGTVWPSDDRSSFYSSDDGSSIYEPSSDDGSSIYESSSDDGSSIYESSSSALPPTRPLVVDPSDDEPWCGEIANFVTACTQPHSGTNVEDMYRALRDAHGIRGIECNTPVRQQVRLCTGPFGPWSGKFFGEGLLCGKEIDAIASCVKELMKKHPPARSLQADLLV